MTLDTDSQIWVRTTDLTALVIAGPDDDGTLTLEHSHLTRILELAGYRRASPALHGDDQVDEPHDHSPAFVCDRCVPAWKPGQCRATLVHRITDGEPLNAVCQHTDGHPGPHNDPTVPIEWPTEEAAALRSAPLANEPPRCTYRALNSTRCALPPHSADVDHRPGPAPREHAGFCTDPADHPGDCVPF